MIKKLAITVFVLATTFAEAQVLRKDVSDREKMGGTIYDEPISFDGIPFTGIIYAKYPSGILKMHKEVKDGLAHGLWREWYPDGVLRYKASWSEGYGEGLWQYFHENGQLRTIGVYKGDTPLGIHLEYDAEGKMTKQEIFIDGEKLESR